MPTIINRVVNATTHETYLDLTEDTVNESNLLQNQTAHNAEGEGIVGQLPEGGAVEGVKGDVETEYREGNVNITLPNVVNIGENLSYNSETKTLSSDAEAGEVINYAQYQALTPEEQANGDYYIPDYEDKVSIEEIDTFTTAQKNALIALLD